MSCADTKAVWHDNNHTIPTTRKHRETRFMSSERAIMQGAAVDHTLTRLLHIRPRVSVTTWTGLILGM